MYCMCVVDHLGMVLAVMLAGPPCSKHGTGKQFGLPPAPSVGETRQGVPAFVGTDCDSRQLWRPIW